jgi:hypothetical protein
MAMCDGSVHFVSFDVEGLVHKRLGSRADGQPATLAQLPQLLEKIR